MLTITRKAGEEIVLRMNGRVIARIKPIRRNGEIPIIIDAGRDVEINRLELDKQKHPEVDHE